uniref:Uncharacterized protein n=1 Tax=Wuchereria bancrofti TaxID=6293 RepID=A0AAF5RV69_WUCBA
MMLMLVALLEICLNIINELGICNEQSIDIDQCFSNGPISSGNHEVNVLSIIASWPHGRT